MAYEIMIDEYIQCPCGDGRIHYVMCENENFHQIPSVTLHCKNCEKKYHVECSELEIPYMDATFYLVPKGASLHTHNRENLMHLSVKIEPTEL